MNKFGDLRVQLNIYTSIMLFLASLNCTGNLFLSFGSSSAILSGYVAGAEYLIDFWCRHKIPNELLSVRNKKMKTYLSSIEKWCSIFF